MNHNSVPHASMKAIVLGMFLLGFISPFLAAAQPALRDTVDDRFLTPIASPAWIPKFVNTLPVVQKLGIRWNAMTNTNFSVRAVPVQQDIIGDGHMTNLLGFAVGTLPATHPGATIVVKKDVPVHVNWINDLGFSYPVPVDTSIMWAYSEPPYTTRTIANNGVPFVPHLHGAHTDAIYDGLPDQWWTPLYHSTSNPLAKGKDFVTNQYVYDNSQESATLWYHDHTHGMTRLNAYMGMAGFYFVRDNNELNLIATHQIPSDTCEIELAIQDKVFWPNGQLAIPNAPTTTRGIATDIILPEFFGNVVCVNGKAWPKLDVSPMQYRFRLLNGSDSRFYHMWLEASDAPGVPISFKQIGTEDGLLPSPVTRTEILVGCGERYDIVVDFAGLQGKQIIVRNDAGAPYGNAMPDPVDPATTGLVMRFDVRNETVTDPVTLAASLRPAIAPLVPTAPDRLLILAEMQDQYGRTMPMLGTVADGVKMFMEPVTESIKLNDIETWKIYNTTMDGHPIHLHLVAFQVVSRQAVTFDQDSLTGAISNIAPAGPEQAMPPELQGWKDTQVMYPGEVTTIRARFDKPGTYVWHCHILSHEEWDMMRPYYVRHTLVATNLLAPANLGTGIDRVPSFSWTPVLDAATYTIQIATNPSFLSPVVNQSAIVGTSFTPGVPLASNTPHYWRVSATNVDGTGPWSEVFSFTTTNSGGTVHFAFVGNTGSSKTVVVPNTAELFLDGVPLVSGDELGVFNSDNVCVGASVWHGTTTAITVWGASLNPAAPGMTSGEAMKYRIWKPSNGLEYIGAVPAYTSGDNLFNGGAVSVLASLNALTYPPGSQAYIMTPGWNMISTYIRPTVTGIASISAPFVDNMTLIKNGNGQVYWPSLGAMSLTNWDNTLGYQVYMVHGDTTLFTGTIERPETKPISLLAGWNMIAYLRYDMQAPNVSFNSILTALVLAKNNYGQVYWPAYGINTISSLMPGQGYMLFVNANAALTYPANTVLPPTGVGVLQPMGTLPALGKVLASHFTPSMNCTGVSATVLLRFAEEIPNADEVAVKNTLGVIVGSGTVNKQLAVVTIWGDDAATRAVDGALAGEALSLAYWSAKDKVEKYLDIEHLADGVSGGTMAARLVYHTNAILVADVATGALIPTAVASLGTVPTEFSLGQNYPNPFNPSTKIVYGLPKDARVTLEVFNVLGQKVGSVIDDLVTAGYHEATFDASHLSSGIYYYRLAGGNFVQTKKMMLVR